MGLFFHAKLSAACMFFHAKPQLDQKLAAAQSPLPGGRGAGL